MWITGCRKEKSAAKKAAGFQCSTKGEAKGMNINTTMDGSKATVALDGRLETTNSGSLEQEFSGLYDQVDELVVDCTNLEYISSSGLRTLLSAVKTMKKKGGFKLTHVSDDVMEILNVTGFADILTIE